MACVHRLIARCVLFGSGSAGLRTASPTGGNLERNAPLAITPYHFDSRKNFWPTPTLLVTVNDPPMLTGSGVTFDQTEVSVTERAD